jgi:A/G-specific adenine glycosylase
MLQQTQVATVIDYFNRFTAAFPTLESLANADEQHVLRLWQGLGYYRRAKNLHQAAKQIALEHNGQLPRQIEQLRSLPGIGRYTAGAIASIAYNLREPIIDGNVARVFSRLFTVREPIDQPSTRDRLWNLAARIVQNKQPGDLNQALMELGAVICRPRQPLCDACPVQPMCLANKTGEQQQLPVTTARTKPTHTTHHVLAIRHRQTYLFTQRPGNGLWPSMWELPTLETSSDGSDPEQPLRRWAMATLAVRLGNLFVVGTFRHQTTHRTIRFTLWHARSNTRPRHQPHPHAVWRRLDQTDDLPLSNPQRQAMTQLTHFNAQHEEPHTQPIDPTPITLLKRSRSTK